MKTSKLVSVRFPIPLLHEVSNWADIHQLKLHVALKQLIAIGLTSGVAHKPKIEESSRIMDVEEHTIPADDDWLSKI